MKKHHIDETKKVLTGIRDYEKLLHEIYGAFSTTLPEYKTFWHEIAVDENTHSFLVDTFISLYDAGDISFAERNFHSRQIKDEIEGLLVFRDKMAMRKVDIRESLEFALVAENSIIERKIFQVREGDPQEFKKLLQVLSKDSRTHYQKVKRLYQSIHNQSYKS